MLRPGLSMRSEQPGGSQTAVLELEAQRDRLQLLVGELLQKNHELRLEVAYLKDSVAGGR
jgi:hypothetical protein